MDERDREGEAAGMLPLTHLSYHIMLALRAGAAHGYAIVKRVDELSKGRVSPRTGTFYSALRRMLDEGVIVEVEEVEGADSSDSRRRYYALTPFGRRVLSAEAERLSELLAQTLGDPGVVG